jgi:hypothetical protein
VICSGSGHGLLAAQRRRRQQRRFGLVVVLLSLQGAAAAGSNAGGATDVREKRGDGDGDGSAALCCCSFRGLRGLLGARGPSPEGGPAARLAVRGLEREVQARARSGFGRGERREGGGARALSCASVLLLMGALRVVLLCACAAVCGVVWAIGCVPVRSDLGRWRQKGRRREALSPPVPSSPFPSPSVLASPSFHSSFEQQWRRVSRTASARATTPRPTRRAS